ncbi:hypothetical protein ACFL6W_05695 [Thermodesulfobacteriota bacterium]
MAWYDAQIWGVLVGGGIVFLSTQYEQRRRENQEKNNLKIAIISEVKVLTNDLISGLESIKEFKEEIEKNSGLSRKWEMIGGNGTPVINENIKNIGLLDEDLIPNVIEFQAAVEAFDKGRAILKEVINECVENKTTYKTVLFNLKITHNSMESLIELGNEIISYN